MTSTPVITIADPIPLPVAPAPSSETAPQPRREYFSELFGTEAVVNVTEPTLTPVLPAHCCGTAVIVAPGGGFHGLSINSEGFDVARWLAARGVAAFVLEYRLVPGGEDPVAEMYTKPGKQTTADMAHAAVLAGADAIAAMQVVRSPRPTSRFDATASASSAFLPAATSRCASRWLANQRVVPTSLPLSTRRSEESIWTPCRRALARSFLSRRRTTSSGSPMIRLRSTRLGNAQAAPLSSTSMRTAATDSGCAPRHCLRTPGSIASATGSDRGRSSIRADTRTQPQLWSLHAS